MNIDAVLKMDAGSVVCVENKATITISGKGDERTFTPSFPSNTPPLSLDTFSEMYKHKHFTPTTATKGK